MEAKSKNKQSKLLVNEVELKLKLIKKQQEESKKTKKSPKIETKAKDSKKPKEKSKEKFKEETKQESKEKTKEKSKEKSVDKKPPKEVKSKPEQDSNSIDTERKWNDYKTHQMKKGQFTNEESQIILNAILDYAYQNNYSEDQVLQLITEKLVKSEDKVWTKIAECLPDRSVQSIHNFCHRKFNPNNYKGDWSEDEVRKLILLHKEHGPKWEQIAGELGRTSTNVKDKFRQIGGKNHQINLKEFNLISCLKLLKYVQDYLTTDENEVKILKCQYKFNDNLENQTGNLYFDSGQKFKIDSSLKEEKSKIIIKKILAEILDFDSISEILSNNEEISWSFIADKMKNYSADSSRNQWTKIIRDFNLEKKCEIRKDIKMLKK